MVVVLEPLLEVTTNLCSQHYPSISKVIPAVKLLQLHYSSLMNDTFGIYSVDQLARDLHTNIKERFNDIEKNHTSAIITAYLDPR